MLCFSDCEQLNCAVILIPVLRNFLSFLRGTWVNNYLPIDKNIVFHKYIGWTIMFWSLVHTLAHYTNFQKIRFALGWPWAVFRSHDEHSMANPAQVPNLVANGLAVRVPMESAFVTLSGATVRPTRVFCCCWRLISPAGSHCVSVHGADVLHCGGAHSALVF